MQKHKPKLYLPAPTLMSNHLDYAQISYTNIRPMTSYESSIRRIKVIAVTHGLFTHKYLKK